MTTFYFIRHGQTTANTLFIKQGIINDARTHLTATGKQQAARLAASFDMSGCAAMLVSPLARTQETAAILNAKAHLPIILDRRLLEISYGKWDGQNNHELERKFPDVYDPILHDVLPTYVKYATDGETFTAVVARVRAFMAAQTAAYPDQSLVVVTHGFTVKAAALAVLKPTDPMTLPEPDNTSVTKITQTASGAAQLWYYNR
ncbi:histidine phosphatase family protein [Lacticaseibacillus jixianensis]|uniref:Histidine phosphatase family protein n=1 Tax=Lacticaseibacillus jixianensis TaxID=2486012 RepID=A0ABW4BBG4_9LACO|nr:histidine phosphatase family protein [Lacticaseibacillus jixianensis]